MSEPAPLDPRLSIRPRRTILGASAVLVPFDGSGAIDRVGFLGQLLRTRQAGLVAAVNMDTGFVNLLDIATQDEILAQTRSALGGERFFAGAFVADHPGDPFRRDRYLARIEAIARAGGVPVIFPSHGLTGLPDAEVVAAHAELARHTDQFLAFELGREFAPAGRIYSLAAFGELMGIPQCIGAKHSSLRREPEWRRLALRDQIRPDFRIFTGNDLAIDMVMYGSDYLLGLSTFAPDLFAERDAWWAAGDPRFYERNDWLQYLGHFAFRDPVPAYKHSAAMFLRLRGWIGDDRTHAGSPERPESDRHVLRTIAAQLGVLKVAE